MPNKPIPELSLQDARQALGAPLCSHARRILVPTGERSLSGRPQLTAVHVCPLLGGQPCPFSPGENWALCRLNPDMVHLPGAIDPRRN